MERASEATLGCDLFLVLGSSLVVYPAAGFPVLAKRNGANLAIVNREPTEQDEIADLVLHSEIGPTLQSCASPGLYFEVSTNQDISSALSALFENAVQTAYLNK